MVFIYIVASTAVLLLLSVALAVFKQREIKMDVVSRETVEDKEFFALRIERDDFLFLKEEESVTFIQSLDDVDEFQMKNLSEQQPLKKVAGETEEKGQQLIMPKGEKKAS